MATAQSQTLELIERLGGASTLPMLRRRSTEQGRLPDTLAVSVRLATLALPAMLRDVLDMAEEEHHYWGLEATAAKRRFRTPRTHQILHAALSLAKQQAEHDLVGARGECTAVLTATDLSRIRTLTEREAQLGEAAAAANAALAAEDYDEAV